jgi:predicted lipoprotein with Yx(FWY)xxD motif
MIKVKTKNKNLMLIYLKRNLFAVLCMALVFNACKKSSSDEPTTPPVNNKKGIQLATDAKFGSVLTDKDGKTLYFFANDATGTPTCTDGCEINWPLYYSADASTDLNLNKAEVGEVTRADGRKQSTYRGYPLYYFAGDAAKGEIKGDGVGGIWFVAKPDYSLMLANAQLVGVVNGNNINYTSTYAVGDGKTIYLTDSKGRTLYAFAPDKNGVNTYTKSATQEGIWPVYESEVLSVPSAVAKADVGVITVATISKKQLTYKGWPLYYWISDVKRGDNLGIVIGKGPGLTWPVLQLNATVAPVQ